MEKIDLKYLQQIPDVSFIYNMSEGKLTFISDGIFSFLGYTGTEVLDLGFEGIMTEDSNVRYVQQQKLAYEKFQKDKSLDTYIFEYKLVAKTGETLWYEASARFVENEDGLILSLGTIRNNEARKSAEEGLFRSEERFRELFDKAPLGYQSLDENGYFITVNKQWCTILGYPEDEVVGQWFGDFLLPGYQEAFRKRFPIFKAQGHIHSEFEMRHKSGKNLFVGFDGEIGHDDRGNFKQTHCILKDITVERKLERELAQNRELLNSLLEMTTDAIYIKDEDGKYVLMNQAGVTFTGKAMVDIIGHTDLQIFDEKQARKLMAEDEQVRQRNAVLTFEEVLMNGEGNSETFLTTQGPIFNSEGIRVGVFGIGRNITDRKKAEESMIHLSYHDQLTGLHNRRFYEEELTRLDKKENLPFALIMADVNGLKLTNDAFGHLEGDRLLVSIANILRQVCPFEDYIARIGGDEFVVLLPGVGSKEARALIDQINRAVTKSLSGKDIYSLSVGCAVKSHASQDMNDIFKEAEDEMYRQKLTENLSMRSNSINLIMKSLYEKNNREMYHSNRVATFSAIIAGKMGFDQAEIKQIRTAGMVHDIGKIGISNAILDKPGKLTIEEWEEIKNHCEVGYRILNAVSDFADIATYVLSHQERWDGKGYPRRLEGKEIPIQSRVITVADAFDAMTSDRSYRKGLSIEAAIEELKRCSGKQFDPEIVEIFISEAITDIRPIMRGGLQQEKDT